MSLFFADIITLWQTFGLPYKVPETFRKVIIPKQKKTFQFSFMLLKLKINQYLHWIYFYRNYCPSKTIMYFSYSFSFPFISNQFKQQTPLHSPHLFQHLKLCRQQVQVLLLQSHLKAHLINLSRLAGAASLLL